MDEQFKSDKDTVSRGLGIAEKAIQDSADAFEYTFNISRRKISKPITLQRQENDDGRQKEQSFKFGLIPGRHMNLFKAIKDDYFPQLRTVFDPFKFITPQGVQNLFNGTLAAIKEFAADQQLIKASQAILGESVNPFDAMKMFAVTGTHHRVHDPSLSRIFSIAGKKFVWPYKQRWVCESLEGEMYVQMILNRQDIFLHDNYKTAQSDLIYPITVSGLTTNTDRDYLVMLLNMLINNDQLHPTLRDLIHLNFNGLISIVVRKVRPRQIPSIVLHCLSCQHLKEGILTGAGMKFLDKFLTFESYRMGRKQVTRPSYEYILVENRKLLPVESNLFDDPYAMYTYPMIHLLDGKPVI